MSERERGLVHAAHPGLADAVGGHEGEVGEARVGGEQAGERGRPSQTRSGHDVPGVKKALLEAAISCSKISWCAARKACSLSEK